MYQADKTEESKARFENIMEFKSEILEFEKDFEGDAIYFIDQNVDVADEYGDGDGDGDDRKNVAGAEKGDRDDLEKKVGLGDFLMHVSLVSDIDNLEEETERVALMTVHSAKGLEFDAVFITGCEDGVFPGSRALGDASQMEEERRLFYVAMTRAKNRLFLSCSATRTLFGNTTYNRMSRFIAEIPKSLLCDGLSFGGKDVRDKAAQTPPKRAGAGVEPKSYPFGIGARHSDASFPKEACAVPGGFENGQVYSVGDSVCHKKYGMGKVRNRSKDKNDIIIEIEFEGAGMKRFIESMVSLRAVK
jgi:DNA helicase-2/ATP-dependent DNA helicase PcrA